MPISIVQSKTAATAAAGTLSARMNGVAANDTLFSLMAQQDIQEAATPTDGLGNAWQRITGVSGLGNVSIAASYCGHSVSGNDTISDAVTGASEGVLMEMSGVADILKSRNFASSATGVAPGSVAITYDVPLSVPVQVKTELWVDSGANQEVVKVTASSTTGFTATFTKAHTGDWPIGRVVNYDGVIAMQTVADSVSQSLTYATATGGLGLLLLAVVGTPTIAFSGTGWTLLGSGAFGVCSWQAYQQASSGPAEIPFGWTFTDASGLPLPVNLAIIGVSFPAA